MSQIDINILIRGKSCSLVAHCIGKNQTILDLKAGSLLFVSFVTLGMLVTSQKQFLHLKTEITVSPQVLFTRQNEIMSVKCNS